MTIAERYARASKSSHLKLEVEPGDVDVVIAAGMSDSLGTLLLRCRQEWDAQRPEFERMYSVLRANREEAEQIRKQTAENDEERRQFAEDAKRALEEAGYALSNSRALALMSMGSLAKAYVLLQDHAKARVAKRNLNLAPPTIAEVVGDALDVWLDQRCEHCCGRGFNGGYGAPVITCRACRATGKRRRVFPSKTSQAHTLGEWLIAEADKLTEEAQRRMVKSLR